MSLPTAQPPPVWSFRLILVCLVAVSACLPMAWISIAKFLLFVSGLVYLIASQFNKQTNPAFDNLWAPWVVLAIVLAFSISLLWPEVDLKIALVALVKHAKLLTILLLVVMIRSAREARIGMVAFAVGQTFLLFSSWLLAAGVPIAWATATGRGSEYVVFSNYLAQSIIFATTTSVFWHLRSNQLWPRWLGSLLAGAALINVFVLLPGRAGYVVAVCMISLAVMWATPKPWRLATLITTPVIALLVLYLVSSPVQEGLSKILHETQSYSIQGKGESSSGWAENSSGWRLNAWHRSVQAIQESPWLGHGVGSWPVTVKRLEGDTALITFGDIRNPHQEYLLWGVELGVGGMLLLLSLMFCMVRDARQFKSSIARASLSVLAAMAIACLFNSALYDGLMGDFFCIALGLLLALGLRTSSSAELAVVRAPNLDGRKGSP